MLAQRGHRRRRTRRAGHVIAQGRRQGVEGDRVRGQPQPLGLRIRRCPRPAEHVGDPLTGLVQPQVQPGRDLGGGGSGQHDGVDEARTEDPEGDLLGAGHRRVEHGARLAHRRKADEGRRVAAEHHQVAPRRAVEQGEIQADGDPQADGQSQEFRRVREVRHEDDAHHRAEQGPEHPVERLRPGGTGQHLTGDVDGAERPVGTRQVDPHGEVHRQHRRGVGLEGEGPIAPAGKGHVTASPSSAPSVTSSRTARS